jgi:cation diffusion facilitator family transporter
VAVAAIVGFAGNEAAALYRIRVGKKIGSAALVADGYHARTDGLTSLGVLVGVVGVVLGFPLADPLVGVVISVAILLVTKDAARAMWHRMMDAVDPEIVETIERTAATVDGVEAVRAVRARWHGHRLHAELQVVVDEDLPTWESHQIVERVRRDLFHGVPRLASIAVHADPCGHGGVDHHRSTAHHESSTSARS